ncbi:hypothetical protein, partial [Ferrovum sp.]|uniref:hypothetical protein n=1 Tax=Ferrovum sp. TaxID=2609467 RepID=UPI002633CF2B
STMGLSIRNGCDGRVSNAVRFMAFWSKPHGKHDYQAMHRDKQPLILTIMVATTSEDERDFWEEGA